MVTNVKLTDIALRQFATQVHSSMHRGIQPFHTELGPGALASEVAWDAVLSSVA